MKIETIPQLPGPFHVEKKRPVKLILVVVTLFAILGGVVYAITNPSLNNTATINTQGAIMVSNGSLSPLNCGTQTYADSGTMAWGTMNPNTVVLGYFCVANTGNTAVTLTASGSPTTGYGTVTYSFGSTTIASGVSTLVTMTWTIPNSNPGPVPNWTTTVTAT